MIIRCTTIVPSTLTSASKSRVVAKLTEQGRDLTSVAQDLIPIGNTKSCCIEAIQKIAEGGTIGFLKWWQTRQTQQSPNDVLCIAKLESINTRLQGINTLLNTNNNYIIRLLIVRIIANCIIIGGLFCIWKKVKS